MFLLGYWLRWILVSGVLKVLRGFIDFLWCSNVSYKNKVCFWKIGFLCKIIERIEEWIWKEWKEKKRGK